MPGKTIRDTPSSENRSCDFARARVLYVDDEEMLLQAFRRVVFGMDVVLDICSSAQEALERASREPYAVIVADFGMPDMNGIEFFEALDGKWPDTARVLTSGMSDFGMAVQAINRSNLFRLRLPLQIFIMVGQGTKNLKFKM